MEERIIITENSIYKSNLSNGVITLMALLVIDARIPILSFVTWNDSAISSAKTAVENLWK